MFEITIQENYILVKFTTAVNYDSVMMAVKTVMRQDNYESLNDIIVFEDLPVFLSHEHLDKIVQEIEQAYPANATRSKTALVITSGFGKVLAQIWIRLARRLPPEFEIFSKFEDAENWILSD